VKVSGGDPVFSVFFNFFYVRHKVTGDRCIVILYLFLF